MLNKISKNDIQGYKTKDLMTKHVITLQPQDNLLKAENMMSGYRIKKIVVVDDYKNKKHPIGILTIKDILKFLISDKKDRDLNEILISEAMTKNLITTNKENSVIDCAKILDKNNNISSLIVIGKEEESEQQEQQESSANKKMSSLSGIITSTDFTRFFSENCIGLTTVKDYMSQPVFTISINEKVSMAAELIIEKNVSRLVVTAATNSHRDRLLGILSESDISRITTGLKSRTSRSVYEYMQAIFASSTSNKLDDSIEIAFIRIQDIFTPNPTTIEKNADLALAAKIMIRHGISGIPVTKSLSSIEDQDKEKKMTKNQQPIGIISKTDIVKALTDFE
jgi:CBS domain-containing protein